MRRSWRTGDRSGTKLPPVRLGGRPFLAAAAVCLAALAGCTSVNSGIDPSGEHVFAAPARQPCPPKPAQERYFDDPMGRLPSDDVVLLLQPSEKVAAVGTEVVLVAGVGAADGFLRTNRRLEWSITPGGVGHFVAVEQGSWIDLLLFDFNWPRKIDNTFAIGSTSRYNARLNFGRCTPETDVLVPRGQAWITLTSPVEGTSNVTVFAPEVYGWDARTRSAAVHWVDAQWQFPPLAINPAGARHVLTTTVTRRSNHAPREGWRVRYEILGGPPAGFLPDGAPIIEVPTNAAGQASAEIIQKTPCHGCNQIGIQVIRPAEAPGAGGERFIVARGGTTATWTAADLSLRKVGPAAALVGATVTYQITAANPGDLPAKDVVLTDIVPDGLTCLGSNPPAEVAVGQLQWRLGDLGARQQRVVEVRFRADRPGGVTNRCEAVAAGGLKAAAAATTAVGGPAGPAPAIGPSGQSPIELLITGPEQAAVGASVTFRISLANRGPVPLANLLIRVQLDPGLEHRLANRRNAIEHPVEEALRPGERREWKLTEDVTRPGRLCQTAEVSGPGIATASRQACITASEAAGPPSGAGPEAGVPGDRERPAPEPAAAPSISMKLTGPSQQLMVGESAMVTIELTNSGTAAAQNVKIVDQYDPALTPKQATKDYHSEDGAITWTIDLPAGQSLRRSVLYACQTASPRACNHVTVTLPDGSRIEDETCVEIRQPAPPPSAAADLGISVSGLHNPVTAGKELTYVIQVTNKGTTAYRGVTVTAKLPDGLAPVALGTSGPEAAKPHIDIAGRTVRFDPIEVAAGGSASYRVHVLANQAGQRRLAVELAAASLAEPKTAETTTEVLTP